VGSEVHDAAQQEMQAAARKQDLQAAALGAMAERLEEQAEAMRSQQLALVAEPGQRRRQTSLAIFVRAPWETAACHAWT
jgi:PBP1b-binding outer membrane lipoprotein LpoB